MADWAPLRELLTEVGDRRRFTWAELDALVGGLPRSAYVHSAFWKGDRSGWSGFTTEEVRVGTSVTFVRRQGAVPRDRPPRADSSAPRQDAGGAVDVVLVGCVKRKLARPAPAQDLYTSALFRKERAYAESTGAAWFILSAEHGLVEPTQVLEPYELRLSTLPRAQRLIWGRDVVHALVQSHGQLAGKTVEIHAGAAYVNAVREPLVAEGAEIVDPLRGLTMGERLAWYGRFEPRAFVGRVTADLEVTDLVRRLTTQADAETPAELTAREGVGLRGPGLYSWWVDASGAADLSLGLGEHVAEGLIYAGLAGATRSRSGRRSKNTLWGRLNGMHLGSRHEFSTFRLSLGSILASALGATEIDEDQLTTWMFRHLQVVAVPVEDADALDSMETRVLAALDPPLNLQKMERTPIRSRLTNLRRQHGRRPRGAKRASGS